MDKKKALIIVLAITWIAILEIIALHYGHNGYLFGLVIAAIAGLAGFEIRSLTKK